MRKFQWESEVEGDDRWQDEVRLDFFQEGCIFEFCPRSYRGGGGYEEINEHVPVETTREHMVINVDISEPEAEDSEYGDVRLDRATLEAQGRVFASRRWWYSTSGAQAYFLRRLMPLATWLGDLNTKSEAHESSDSRGPQVHAS
jgi:hypothetical protein